MSPPSSQSDEPPTDLRRECQPGKAKSRVVNSGAAIRMIDVRSATPVWERSAFAGEVASHRRHDAAGEFPGVELSPPSNSSRELRLTSPACGGGIGRTLKRRRGEASAMAKRRVRALSTSGVSIVETPPPQPSPASGRGSGARLWMQSAHFIGHLSWKRSWSFSTMVATVFSESWPSASFTTSWR
jgi:hypothetical protein